MTRRIAIVACIPFMLAGCGATDSESYRYAAEPAGRGGVANECVVCHSIEKDGPFRSAPPLWGVVGSKKARFGWFGYSSALARAGGEWTEADLDAYLADPDAFLPGTTKTLIGIRDDDERAELITFLASLNE
jgi:cytochrome c